MSMEMFQISEYTVRSSRKDNCPDEACPVQRILTKLKTDPITYSTYYKAKELCISEGLILDISVLHGIPKEMIENMPVSAFACTDGDLRGGVRTNCGGIFLSSIDI